MVSFEPLCRFVTGVVGGGGGGGYQNGFCPDSIF